jgi:ribose 5-phosphate isomerase A
MILHDMHTEDEKRIAAEAAAELVEEGMTVGLGTGSTVAYLLPALAARGLTLRCIATSHDTEEQARSAGLPVEPFDGIARLDIAIDGADQIARDGWIVKGGGAAHTREKVVASSSDRFVVIASSDKLVDTIAPPIPLELLPYGLDATLARLGEVELRDVPPIRLQWRPGFPPHRGSSTTASFRRNSRARSSWAAVTKSSAWRSSRRRASRAPGGRQPARPPSSSLLSPLRPVPRR